MLVLHLPRVLCTTNWYKWTDERSYYEARINCVCVCVSLAAAAAAFAYPLSLLLLATIFSSWGILRYFTLTNGITLLWVSSPLPSQATRCGYTFYQYASYLLFGQSPILSTNRAQRCLTSVIKWAPVCPTWQDAILSLRLQVLIIYSTICTNSLFYCKSCIWQYAIR
jgi:hypothetical protein